MRGLSGYHRGRLLVEWAFELWRDLSGQEHQIRSYNAELAVNSAALLNDAKAFTNKDIFLWQKKPCTSGRCMSIRAGLGCVNKAVLIRLC